MPWEKSEVQRSATKDDVRIAYNLILEREPESESVIESKLPTTIEDLYQHLMKSDEFYKKLMPCFNLGSNFKKSHIQIHASEEEQKLLHARTARQWGRLGEEEPHWSVLVHDQFKQSNIKLDEFYQTGENDLELLKSALDRIDLSLKDLNHLTLLELGCGVGRVTSHLAPHFEKVIALDISPGNLSHAIHYCDQIALKNVSFHLLKQVDEVSQFKDFDFFFSCIVLQHNPPPVQLSLLDQIFSNLNSGGYVYFQIPTYQPGYAYNIQDYLNSNELVMDMHCMPQHEIFSLFSKHGLRAIDVTQDLWTGPEFVSHTFFAKKY